MPISVTCSECDKKLKVKDEAAGKKVRCPGCSELISVPQAQKLELDDLEDYDEDDDFEPRKPASKRSSSSDEDLDELDDLEDDVPVRKPSKKSSKKAKGKAKARPQRAWAGDFPTEFYEGQLSTYLAYVFWGVFFVLWLCAISGQTMLMVFLLTTHFIVAIRGLINLYWWAKLCADDAPAGALIYILFFLVPAAGLFWGATNNDIAEKPNRLFMFSIGIIALSWVFGILSIVMYVALIGGTWTR